MALVFKDRIKETTTTTGQGTITLAGAVDGFQNFSSSIGDGNTTYFVIFDNSSYDWEVGIGTYTASGNTLSRDTVLSTSAGNTTKIDFGAGSKEVFVSSPADKHVYLDASGDLTINGTTYLNAIHNRWTKTATSGQTVFSGTDNSGNTLSVSAHTQVFINGILLENSDYNLGGTTTVTLASGASASDIVEIISFAPFTTALALQPSNNLSDLASVATARANLNVADGATAYANSDVDTHLNTSGASTNQYLQWSGSDYQWAGVSGYTDADVNTHLNQSSASSNQFLQWNGSDYVWAVPTDTNTNTTYSAGSGIDLSGTTFSHSDTSSQSSSNNSGRTYIQDITLDTYGHVTGISTATETVVDTNTNTTYSAGTNLGLSGTTFNLDNNITLSGTAQASRFYIDTTNQYIDSVSGNYGTIKVEDTDSYAGYAIRDDWVFMSNGATMSGIYNDTNNEWSTIWRQNGATEIHHNGVLKIETTATGADITGILTTDGLTVGSGTAPSGSTTDLFIKSSAPLIELQDSDDNTYSRVYHSAGGFYIDVDRANSGSNSVFQVKIDDDSSSVFKFDNSGAEISGGLKVDTDMSVGTSSSLSSMGQLGIYRASSPYISFHDGTTSRTSYFQETGGIHYHGEVTYTQSVGSFRAPVFYDTSDASYYCDPTYLSNFVHLNLNGQLQLNGSYGSSGQVLQSNGSSDPTWVTPSSLSGVGGGWEFVSGSDNSSTATTSVTFDNLADDSYYKLLIYGFYADNTQSSTTFAANMLSMSFWLETGYGWNKDYNNNTLSWNGHTARYTSGTSIASTNSSSGVTTGFPLMNYYSPSRQTSLPPLCMEITFNQTLHSDLNTYFGEQFHWNGVGHAGQWKFVTWGRLNNATTSTDDQKIEKIKLHCRTDTNAFHAKMALFKAKQS